MIKFTPTSFYVHTFLQRYQIWANYQKILGPHETVASLSHDADAVPVFHRWEISAITNHPSPWIAIDLKEGFKEFSAVNATLPHNKHYFIFSGSMPTNSNIIAQSHTLICHEFLLAHMIDLHLNTKNEFFYSNRSYDCRQSKPLLFVAFVDNPRPHRLKFANWLDQLPFDNFVFRLNKKDFGQSADHLDIIDFTKSGSDIAQWFESTAQHIASPHLHIMARIPHEMLNQARFNLVLETDFEIVHGVSCCDTTEKTIRPLLMGMPFVLASTPGHLARLHDLGFQTYHTLWDESYDTELDPDRRLRKIFDLVRNLADFDWQAHGQSLHEIGLHNKANFFNLGQYFDKEFKLFESQIKQLVNSTNQRN